ncbi:hypothetical protein RRG08_046748 [Elysia crispata]|uniref:Uncharacterized protein n=1 Tax=Elysia crispata TaxID=231223 RepID=A0AAE0ZWB1_9GAST|nr:hypothetical protein RRG08_046748 [Elysia crispata]
MDLSRTCGYVNAASREQKSDLKVKSENNKKGKRGQVRVDLDTGLEIPGKEEEDAWLPCKHHREKDRLGPGGAWFQILEQTRGKTTHSASTTVEPSWGELFPDGCKDREKGIRRLGERSVTLEHTWEGLKPCLTPISLMTMTTDSDEDVGKNWARMKKNLERP